MKCRALFFLPLLVCTTWLYCGCEEDQHFPYDGLDRDNNTSTNTPPTLAGRSYNFSVTANNSFAEEYSNEYNIDFQTETSYVLHPSQQARPIPDASGSYSYDQRSATVHLIQTQPVARPTVEIQLNFLNPRSGTAHLVGANNETQDAVFVQTAP